MNTSDTASRPEDSRSTVSPSLLSEDVPTSGAQDPAKPEWTEKQRGQWAWRIRPAWLSRWQDSVLAADELSLPPSDATPIKSNDERIVFRMPWGRARVFVKCARAPKRGAWIQHWWRGSNAQREHRVILYARRHGIATVEIVATAESPINGRAYHSLLVTAELPDALPLNEAWTACAATRAARNALIDEVARLIAYAHQNGFCHHDLHAGNILIQRSATTGMAGVFVDLQNVRIGRRVGRDAVLRNLAQIHQWFSFHASVMDRWRFFKRYLQWRKRFESSGRFAQPLDGDARELLPRLRRAIRRHTARLNAKRDRVALRSGRYFARLDLDDGWSARVALSTKHPVPDSRVSQLRIGKAEWKAILADPRAGLNSADRKDLLKNSPTGIVARGTLSCSEGERLSVVRKVKRPRSRWKRWLSSFRVSRSLRTWKRGHALLHRRIPTPRPLAVLERRRGGLLCEDILITEFIEHGVDLDTFLTLTLRSQSPERQQRLKSDLIDALVRLVSDLDAHGFVHADLKALNVLVQWKTEGSEPLRVWLIDLDGLRRQRVTDRVRAPIRMMMRLNVSLDHVRRLTRTDRLRFLQRYLMKVARSDGDWKTLWRETAHHSAIKRRRKHRRQESRIARGQRA